MHANKENKVLKIKGVREERLQTMQFYCGSKIH